MKSKQVIVMILLLCSTVYAFAQSRGGRFDLNRDQRVVDRYIAQSSSHAAMEYLNKIFENDQFPEDADVMFGYAVIFQKLLVQIQKESMAAVGNMDIMTSMTTTIDEQTANNKMISLLFLAANKGHRGAYELLQLKLAMQAGGNSLPSLNQGSSGSSVIGRKTCSMCNGKGWIQGSKTPTYGNMGTYWCDKCHMEVTMSHSHDRCPSCGGSGTVPTIH